MYAIKRHIKRAMQNLYIMFFSKWKCEPRGHCIGLWCFTQVKWYQRMKMTIHTIWLLLFNLYFSEGICGSMCSIIINSDRFLFSFFFGEWLTNYAKKFDVIEMRPHMMTICSYKPLFLSIIKLQNLLIKP